MRTTVKRLAATMLIVIPVLITACAPGLKNSTGANDTGTPAQAAQVSPEQTSSGPTSPGQVSPGTTSPEQAPPAPAPEVPASGPQAAGVQTPPLQEYRIQPGDLLDIKFFYNPELNEQLPVRPDGRISLQLAHEIMAAGLTPVELTAALKERYATELAKPEITVIVRSISAGPRMVFVDGEVNRAGTFNLTGPLTVLQSLSLAGGLRDTARSSEIILIRRDANNRAAVQTVNIKKVLDGTDMSQDLILQPFDIVYVPKSPIANLNLWVDQYIRKNIPIAFGTGYYLGGLQ